MRETESAIINLLVTSKNNSKDRDVNRSLHKNFSELMKAPFKSCSVEFLDHPLVQEYCLEKDSIQREFWYLIESYLSAVDNPDLQKERFAKLENCFHTYIMSDLEKEEFKTSEEAAKAGWNIFPQDLITADLIKAIYQSGDRQLIDFFKNELPLPKSYVFKGSEIPEIVLNQEKETTAQVRSFLKKNDSDFKAVEESVKKFQRQIRRSKRENEEKYRVKHFYPHESEQELNKARQPYFPKCEESLAERITETAKKLDLYPTIRHLTAKSALGSICNDGFLGRKNLVESYLAFKPAALKGCDLRNGDANVVCFGTKDIDPLAVGEVEIILDLKKVIQSQPAAFYKAMDLEYVDNEIRTIPLGSKSFHFSTTNPLNRAANPLSSEFNVYETKKGGRLSSASLPKYKMIACDLQNMNQIQVLNFFRFIDQLKPADYATDFYKELAKMNEEELETCLRNIANEFTNTAEFNFYGTYQLDFSSLLSIKDNRTRYTLELEPFIASLESGDVKELQKARKTFPSLFKSYRFLDYLISKVAHPDCKKLLENLRKQCEVPDWFDNQYYESLVIDKKEIAAIIVPKVMKEVDAIKPNFKDIHAKEAVETYRDYLLKQLDNILETYDLKEDKELGLDLQYPEIQAKRKEINENAKLLLDEINQTEERIKIIAVNFSKENTEADVRGWQKNLVEQLSEIQAQFEETHGQLPEWRNSDIRNAVLNKKSQIDNAVNIRVDEITQANAAISRACQAIENIDVNFDNQNTVAKVKEHKNKLIDDLCAEFTTRPFNAAYKSLNLQTDPPSISRAMDEKHAQIKTHAKERKEAITAAEEIIAQTVALINNFDVDFINKNNKVAVDSKVTELLEQLNTLTQTEPFLKANAILNLQNQQHQSIADALGNKQAQIAQIASARNARLDILSKMHFDEHFSVFIDKTDELIKNENSNYQLASKKSLNFCNSLINAKEKFLQKNIPLAQAKRELKKDCLKAADQARETLNEHREWKGAIAKFIIDVVSCLKQIDNLWGMFRQTDSGRKLAKFEGDVAKISVEEDIANRSEGNQL